MREGWKIKKLGDICEVINGLWLGKKEPFMNVAVIRNTNFSKDCQLQLDNVAFINVEAKQFASRKLQYGDIIIEKSGGSEKQPVGRVVLFDLIDGNYSFSNFTSALRIKKESQLHPKFLHKCLYEYYIKGETLKLQSKTTGLRNLDMKAYLRLPIPVPPLAEQERIVGELDLLSGVIAKKREQLTQLDTLAQSIFYTMFGDPISNEKGWEKFPLKESVVEMFLGPFGSSLKTDCYVNKDQAYCMVYEQKHAIKKTLELENHFIDRNKFDSLKRFAVHSGDFIMSCRGTIGEIFRLPDNAPDGIIHPSLMKIRIKEDIYNPIFFIQLLTHVIKNEKTNGNCVQMAITAKELGTRKLILPPLSLQQQFAEKIDAIERQKERIRQSLTEVQQLFDSRMDFYFN